MSSEGKRFENYLRSFQIAKAHLITADQHARLRDDHGAVLALIRSLREFETCVNNLASMHFKKKPKRESRKLQSAKMQAKKILIEH
ncbi:MAG TPA: hypothetical protein VF974_08110 [Patescibacteria group bacterium]